MRRVIVVLLILSVLASLLVFGLYLYKFGSIHQATLSPLMSEWGQVGDYVGGMLGTYFAFLAFLAVLGTVWLQNKQLEHAHSQSTIDELQRLMASSAAQIDSSLYAETRYSALGPHATVHDVLLACFEIALTPRSDEDDAQLTEMAKALRAELPPVLRGLQHLATCALVHQQRGGSREIGTIYRMRYEWEVIYAQAMGFLSKEDAIERYFRPGRYWAMRHGGGEYVPPTGSYTLPE